MTLRCYSCFPLALAALIPAALLAADDNEGFAGNRRVELEATAFTDHDEVTEAVGADLGEHFVVVRIEVVPQTPEGLDVSIDDFTLISRKDGERAGAMEPSEIAGSVALIVGQPGTSGGGIGTQSGPRLPAPVGGPLGGPGPGAQQQPYPNGGGGAGNAPGIEGGLARTRIEDSGRKVDPRRAILEDRILPEVKTADPVEGLLYFFMEGKVKPKDLGLLYNGSGGRLVIDFD